MSKTRYTIPGAQIFGLRSYITRTPPLALGPGWVRDGVGFGRESTFGAFNGIACTGLRQEQPVQGTAGWFSSKFEHSHEAEGE